MGERKEEDDNLSEEKKAGKTKQCYHNDICRWKMDVFVDVNVFPMKLKLQGESFL